jgi:hypothetical protein
MAKSLTRSELYALIWLKPRTALAKELGISDVAIGKHCARAHVPGPPPGYWARLSSGKQSARLPLPLRLPGQEDEIVLGGENRYYRSVPENLDEELVPPAFYEDPSYQVADAIKRLGRVTLVRDLSDPDGGLKRILSREAKRRAEHERHRSSYYEPYYDAPRFQRQLRIFASLARAFGRLYGPQEVVSTDEWVQGLGTLHQLTLPLRFGGIRLDLEFLEPGQASGTKKEKGVESTTLRTGGEGKLLGVQDWSDSPGAKLESQLDSIAKALLERAEKGLRLAEQRRYEYRLERRQEMREEIERRKIAAEKKRLEAIASHREAVRAEVIELSRQYRTANDIREMVALLSGHPDVRTGAAEVFAAWSTQAMSVADLLDPLRRPFLESVPIFGKKTGETS